MINKEGNVLPDSERSSVKPRERQRWTLTPSKDKRTKGYPLVVDGPMLAEPVEVAPVAEVERLREALATIAAFNSREGVRTGLPSAEARIARDALNAR